MVTSVLLVTLGLILGIIVAPGGHGGLVLTSYHDKNLWVLVPAGWKDEDLVAPYGTALDGWFDPSNSADSVTVRASLPTGRSPQARAELRARQLGRLPHFLGTITLAGGRSAWVVQYGTSGSYSAIVEFSAACTPAIAMTVTLDASSQGTLADEIEALPAGTEPVCDGPAFTSPDGADLAIPLHLPS